MVIRLPGAPAPNTLPGMTAGANRTAPADAAAELFSNCRRVRTPAFLALGLFKRFLPAFLDAKATTSVLHRWPVMIPNLPSPGNANFLAFEMDLSYSD
jgi:hypothetical protein